MTVIKICGITNLEDALVAVEAGADVLGFNFYRLSPRYIEPQSAASIIAQLPTETATVGVFVNEDPNTLQRKASEAGVSVVQLHGDESPEYCEALKSFRIIKAFAVGKEFDESILDGYSVEAIMLDASHKKLRGGTGQTIDWSVAQRIDQNAFRLFLAGGLSPDNVKTAIATVRPYAVDACSALESSPGKKDHERMRAFILTARALEFA